VAFDLSTCTFLGPALPAPFVKLDLEAELHRAKLLPKRIGDEGYALQDSWDAYRRKLRELIAQGGAIRVLNHVIEPLVARLGYAKIEQADLVRTRLEPDKGESGGWRSLSCVSPRSAFACGRRHRFGSKRWSAPTAADVRTAARQAGQSGCGGDSALVRAAPRFGVSAGQGRCRTKRRRAVGGGQPTRPGPSGALTDRPAIAHPPRPPAALQA
jgi:hypothetical protein